MRRIPRNVLPIAILLLSAISAAAQDPETLRHFDYDQRAPLGIKHLGVQRRAHATVYDVTYSSPKGGVVPAYLVVPKGRGPFAAIIWGHWYWGNSSMRNRKQFLDEAIVMARAGVVSLLTDGPVARAGHVENREPLNEQQITDLVQQVTDMRRGVDLLLARKDVDRKRLAYVGHSADQWHSESLSTSGPERVAQAFNLQRNINRQDLHDEHD